MFRPNVNCTITPASGQTDVFGQTAMGKPYKARCGIVRLEVGAEKTAVRTDASASGSFAFEITGISRLLFEPKYELNTGDKVTVHGFDLEVISLHPRYNVQGKWDHTQVDLKKWQSE